MSVDVESRELWVASSSSTADGFCWLPGEASTVLSSTTARRGSQCCTQSFIVETTVRVGYKVASRVMESYCVFLERWWRWVS